MLYHSHHTVTTGINSKGKLYRMKTFACSHNLIQVHLFPFVHSQELWLKLYSLRTRYCYSSRCRSPHSSSDSVIEPDPETVTNVIEAIPVPQPWTLFLRFGS